MSLRREVKQQPKQAKFISIKTIKGGNYEKEHVCNVDCCLSYPCHPIHADNRNRKITKAAPTMGRMEKKRRMRGPTKKRVDIAPI